MNIELLTRIRDWLEAGAPETEAPRGLHFNMGSYLTLSGTSENWCGTACCIAGSAVVFHYDGQIPLPAYERDHLDYHGVNSVDSLEPDPDADGVEIHEHAAKLLDLDPVQADQLFLPYGYRHTMETITPAEAAQAITHLIETGEVQWPTN